MNFIPYGRQDISKQDEDLLLKTLRSDWLTQGPMIKAFEDKLCEYTGAKYASALNSATSALHIACLALGVGPGDYVWTSPNTFVASANCALYCGAKVDFVDIDQQTYNLCPFKLEEKLKVAKEKNELPKVVIPVHLTGQSCDMKKIHELSKEFRFKIIEDASHAIGGKYLDKPVGNCEYSDITVFSFHPVKIVTTAEGGACLTNDEDLFDRIDLLRSHGVTRRDKFIEKTNHGPWYYEQVDLGLNYRITDLQATLGVSQMGRLDKFITKRHQVANLYNDKLAELPLKRPFQAEGTYNSFHLYVIKVEASKRKEVFEKMREANIGVNVHYIPVYYHPYYERLGFKKGLCPNAEEYYDRAISIPMFPTLKKEEQDYVCAKLEEFLS